MDKFPRGKRAFRQRHEHRTEKEEHELADQGGRTLVLWAAASGMLKP